MKDDLIKRNDAILRIDILKQGIEELDDRNFVQRLIDRAVCNLLSNLIDLINNIPSADRPQGEWKHLKGDEWLCSECGHVVWTEGSWEHPLERGKNYCEHCGADMRGADDETD